MGACIVIWLFPANLLDELLWFHEKFLHVLNVKFSKQIVLSVTYLWFFFKQQTITSHYFANIPTMIVHKSKTCCKQTFIADTHTPRSTVSDSGNV